MNLRPSISSTDLMIQPLEPLGFDQPHTGIIKDEVQIETSTTGNSPEKIDGADFLCDF